MHLTKYEQSGVLIDGVAVDIGSLTSADVHEIPTRALLYTHRHADHLDVAFAATVGAPACAPTDAARVLAAAGVRVTIIRAGETKLVGGLTVTAFAVDHGPISEPIDNLGYAVATASKVRVLVVGDAKLPILEVPELDYDVALIAIGGGKVFTPQEADAELRRIGFNGIAIPCHYDRNPSALAVFEALAGRSPYTVAVRGTGETLAIEGEVIA